MELKDRKRINNQLPKYEIGRDDWSRLYGLADLYAITPSGPSYPTFLWNNLGGINPENVSAPNLNPFVSGGIKPNLNMLADQNPIVGTKKLNLAGNIDPNRAINHMDLSGKNLSSLNFSKLNPDIEAQKMKVALGTPQSLPNLDKFDAPERQNAGASIGPFFALGQWIAGGVGDGLTKVLESTGEMDQRAGTSIGYGAGFNYKRQNILNLGDEMARYDKETAGSALTSPGKTLAMLSGRDAHERKVKEHMRKAELGNIYRRGVGMSDYMAQQFYSKHGDSLNQPLYHVKDGKDRGQSLYTALGKLTPWGAIKADARVAGDESIVNLDTISNATGTVVRDGKRGIDGPLAYLRDNDIVLGTLKDLRTGIPFMDEARPATEMLEAINKIYEKPIRNDINSKRGLLGRQTDSKQQEVVNKMKAPYVEELRDYANQQLFLHMLQRYTQMNNAKNGKDRLPGYKLGSNWWIDGMGVLAGLGQIFHAAFNKPRTYNTYADNPYEGAALNKLAAIRMNRYPIIRQLRDQENRNKYAINRAGGLSGALKNFANVATGIGTQRVLAEAEMAILQQNNQYAGSYANTLLSAGQANRVARQAANQWGLEQEDKAHNARGLWGQTGILNILAALQQGYANQWKRAIHKDNMDLYRQDLDLRRRNLYT